MKQVGVALLGLGTVGGGTYEILTKNRAYIASSYGIDISVEGVLEINKARLAALSVPEELAASNIMEIVSNPNVDIVAEFIGGTTFAKEFVTIALKNGKSVVTANKELIAKYWHELEPIAKNKGVGLYFEASCVGGVPVIRTLTESLQGDEILSITGIINGTTNFILSKMADEGQNYADVLKEAQALGYAEADPTADVEGFDAMYKLSILSSLAFQKKVPLSMISREGISKVDIEDIRIGKQMGYTLKLLAIGKNTQHGIEARVHPAFISNDHPLATVKGSFNAVHIVGDNVGDVMLYGRGAGALPTGSAIVSDIVYAAKHMQDPTYTRFENDPEKLNAASFADDFESDYYIRMLVKDETGVLAKVSGIFAEENVSITQVVQNGEVKDGGVTIVYITHRTMEKAVRRALDKIATLPVVSKINSVIRVEK